MCGIAGIAGVAAADRRDRTTRMRELIRHRGPDAAGAHDDPLVSLAIRRLRIIDLATGDQPQSNENGTVWTVFNGEIYNFRELRTALAARGHRLATASDTEVIVHLYEDLGERFVERLEGMFALAVWDQVERRLILARDRMGKKPLLYTEVDGELIFSSEHRSLLAGLPYRPAVDGDAIRAYLRLGYVPAPMDAFAGVRKLLPAHYLVWESGRSRVERYWSPPPSGTSTFTDEQAASELRRVLDRAVARRLVADVPLGAFLSGGVDSSAIVATMAGLSANVKTFSIGFEDETYSELAHARRIAERFGTSHHEFVVRPLEADVVPLLVRHYGEPYADSSSIPTFHLSRVTRGHVTVALAGDGGDELFAGYDRYRAALLASRFDRIPKVVREVTFGSAARVLSRSSSPKTLANRALRYARVAVLEPTARYLSWAGIFDPLQLNVLLAPAFAERTRRADRALESDGHRFGDDPVSAAQLLDLRLYLPDDLLVKVDIASMANSLEVRAPFLDREMVEFAVRLPADQKLRGNTSKYILKRAFAGVVPAENLHRAKMGFSVPLASWLRNELRDLALDTTISERARRREFFRADAVRRLVDEHMSRRADHAARIWALVMLELWHREFVDA
jgi:asparagine synthase (glutamine-hydrolysing)